MIDIGLCQKNVISEWIIGNHTEDVNLFEPCDFAQYADIVRAVKDGARGYLDVAEKTEWTIPALTEMVSDATPGGYQGSLDRCIKYKSMQMLEHVSSVTLEKTLSEVNRLMSFRTEPEQAQPWETILEQEMNRRRSEKVIGYPFKIMHGFTGGIHKGELSTVAARPAVGKSSFAMQIAEHVAERENSVLFIPLEMTKTELLLRIVSGQTRIPALNLKRGSIKGHEEEYDSAVNYIKYLEMYLDIWSESRTIEGISAKVRRDKPDVVIIDQLSQIQVPGTNTIRERFTEATRRLKALALEQETAIILCAQLNRGAEDRVCPTLADLKESGSIEEDSDNVFFLYRINDSPEWIKQGERHIKLSIAKQRNGETGGIDLAYRGDKFLFREYNAKVEWPD